ncbi:MAG: IPExxxVDY family protein [Sphingobacteriales bacterium]|nr:MAG: IPExxxVDY family protein [Sphingobacteriales bacterium]
MIKVHKLNIGDFDAEDYGLIAIHSALEDYRLAYFINRELDIKLEKCPHDVAYRVKEGKSLFSRYFYEDDVNDAAWNLVQNRHNALSTQENTSLFSTDGVSVSVCLLPELKTVDYVLKVENAVATVPQLLLGLQAISQVATAYKIDHYKLKSKNNLIF